MALKDTLNQQKTEIPQPDNLEATSQDLQQLIQVLTEIRNYSGATLQQKSLEKANLENNLQEIQSVTNSVLNNFNSSSIQGQLFREAVIARFVNHLKRCAV